MGRLSQRSRLSGRSLGGIADPFPEDDAEKVDIVSALLEQQKVHERRVEQLLERHLERVIQTLSAGDVSAGDCAQEHPEQPPKGLSASFFGPEPDVGLREPSAFGDDFQVDDAGFAVAQDRDRLSTWRVDDEGFAGRPAHARLESVDFQPSTWREQAGMTIDQLEGSCMKERTPTRRARRVTVADMKQGLDLVAGDLKYGRVVALVQKMVGHQAFEYFFQAFIVANAVALGVEQDWLVRNIGQTSTSVYFFIEFTFGCLFLAELVLRIFAGGLRFFSYKNENIKWNLFDTVLVCSSVTEIVLQLSTDGSTINMSTSRLLRLLRLVRLLRVIRVFRFFKVLRIMVLSILISFRPLVFALLLLFTLIYIFTVCLLQFVTEELSFLSLLEGGRESSHFRDLQSAFGSLPRTAYTLFLSISGGLSWGEACAPLLDISVWLGLLFMVYVTFCIFCVLNIITGIFVEEASAMTAEDEENMLLHEMQRRKRFVAEVKRFFAEANQDGSGRLSWPEFSERLENVRMQKLLENLGIDVISCGARNVFDLFDNDGTGEIAIGQFTSALTQMRGAARSIDLASLRYEHQKVRRDVKSILKHIACQSERGLAGQSVPSGSVRISEVRARAVGAAGS